ncbi:unnamed protein product [Camellia sinensis]
MTKPPQIAILGAGIFVRTQYIPRLTEISDLVVLKAIWSRTEESARGAVEIARKFFPEVECKWGDTGLDEIIQNTSIVAVAVVLAGQTQVQKRVSEGRRNRKENETGKSPEICTCGAQGRMCGTLAACAINAVCNFGSGLGVPHLRENLAGYMISGGSSQTGPVILKCGYVIEDAKGREACPSSKLTLFFLHVGGMPSILLGQHCGSEEKPAAA